MDSPTDSRSNATGPRDDARADSPTSARPSLPARAADAGATVAEGAIAALAATGTRRLFGMPGGGSSLDLIEAARRQGMGFVLARHEGAAVMMAAADAELGGHVGAVLTTKGPGTANAANGVAHASLDRCPVAVFTDGFSPTQLGYVTHQWFDQRAMLAPVVKGHTTFEPAPSRDDIAALLALARQPRRGPVHIELTGPASRASLSTQDPGTASAAAPADPSGDLDRAASLLMRARRPVVVAGLEARDPDIAAATRALVRTLGCPALVTYKSKGVIPDDDDAYVGIFTGGAAERAAVEAADLIVLVGLDPVELILQPWPYALPVLEIGWTPHPVHYVQAECAVHDNPATTLAALAAVARPADWRADDIAGHRTRLRDSLAYEGNGQGLTPEAVVTVAAEVAAGLELWPRATVDAGAHMFSATAFWPCFAPNGLLISNGLASMGFALPAGIAAALHEPDRAVLAFTGDGGLMMCLGELATAVEQRARLVVVVFNDGALSLIDIKQQSRTLPAAGVRWAPPDFAAVMQGLGGLGLRVDTPQQYAPALERAFAHRGPSLIDVRVDPSGYPGQLRAMRG
ncbi:MAG: thiamine pyrophosphate-binding protein [Burkholderiaceae bacterium]